MKTKVKVSLLAACFATYAVNAQPIFIDGNYDADISDATEQFNSIDTEGFQAISYYVDADADNTVSTGEFVFDFGLNIEINGFTENLTDAEDGGFGTDWGLVADYLIYGEALVLENPSVSSSLNGEYDDFSVAASPFGSQAAEVLAANISDGIFNLFIDTDSDGFGDVLAATYEVTNVAVEAGSPNLVIQSSGVYALPDFFYRGQDGKEFSYLLANGANWTSTLNTFVSTSTTPAQFVPGSYNPNGEAIQANVGGVDVAYYGESAFELTQSANGCPDGTFGYCNGSQTTIPFDPTTVLWRDVRDTIRDIAGDSPILARTTSLGAQLNQTISEPGILGMFGASLLALCLIKRRRKA